MDRAFSMNQALDNVYRWPTDRARKWTADLINSARRDGNILALVAVGSAVRPDVESLDLDLVVICRELPGLSVKPPLEIDVRAYTADQIDSLLSGGDDMVGWAVKFGRLLFQREGFWDALSESWSDRIPMPSADTAIKRAKDALRRLKSVLEVGDADAAHEQAVFYLTHMSRAELIKRKVYPASRPELPRQLRSVGCRRLASSLELALSGSFTKPEQISRFIDQELKTRQ